MAEQKATVVESIRDPLERFPRTRPSCVTYPKRTRPVPLSVGSTARWTKCVSSFAKSTRTLNEGFGIHRQQRTEVEAELEQWPQRRE